MLQPSLDRQTTVNDYHVQSLLECLESCIQYNFFQSLVYSRSYDVICNTKTGLHKIFLTVKVTMSFIDETESRRGGILVAIKDSIQSKVVSISGTMKMFSVQLDIVPKLVVSCIYSPFNCSTQAQEEILSCSNLLSSAIDGKD